MRKHRHSEPGRAYFITCVTESQARLFADADIALRIVEVIESNDSWGDADVLAWVLMPDHFHAVIQLGDRLDVSEAVQRFKSFSTKHARLTGLTMPSIWQRGYYERMLRWQDVFSDACRYVLENPVRAGLVRSVNEYPYWGSSLVDEYD